MMRRLLRPLWVFLALVFLFEAWLWSHLAPIVAWIVARIPWRVFKEKVASWIVHLPPYATLLVFLVPAAILLPFKFLGLWMLARGLWLSALALLALVKIVGMGMTAFIFDLTRPKLLQLPWFRSFYDWVMTGLAWAHRLIDPIKMTLRARLIIFRRRAKIWLRMLGPRRASRALKLFLRLRRRINRRPRTA